MYVNISTRGLCLHFKVAGVAFSSGNFYFWRYILYLIVVPDSWERLAKNKGEELTKDKKKKAQNIADINRARSKTQVNLSHSKD